MEKLKEKKTHQSTIKKELIRKEQILELSMIHSPIGMAHVALDGSWIMVNKALLKMFGYSETELLQSDFQSITHPEDLDKDLALLEKTIAGQIDTYRMEKRYLHKSGHYVWGWLSVALLRDEKGEPIHFVSQIVDISERKAAEDELIQKEKLLQKIMKSAPIGMSLLNEKMEWVTINKALYHMFGYEEAAFLQKRIDELILPEDREIGKEKFAALLSKKIARAKVEKRHLHKNGQILWLSLSATIIWDEQKMKYLLVQWTDITPIKEKEKVITHLNQNLENRVKKRTTALRQANKELKNFAYVLTHDLRQPLKNVTNLSGLLKEEYTEQVDEEGQYMLELIHKNTSKVDNLIVDMLDYAKSTNANFKREPVDLKAIFQEKFDLCKTSYNHLLISFELEDLPWVIGDQAALGQVCQNLVSNALKYSSKQPKIIIRVSAEYRAEEAIFQIKDNGIGFDNSKSHKVFEVFQRLHKNSEFEGTGIGMPITAKIIEKHGGRIWVESAVGQGTTFYFTLPIALSQTKTKTSLISA
ncbi:MAG: PAS domain S-box protein [Bacteroidota bacterium]